MNSPHYLISTDCRITVSATNAVIYDLTRETFREISPAQGQFLLTLHKTKVEEWKECDEIRQNWIKEALQEEWIFPCPETFLSSFPGLDFTWKSPSKLSNAQVESEILSQHIVHELDLLGTKTIQVLLHSKWTVEYIRQLTSYFKDSTCLSIQFIMPYKEEITNIDDLEGIYFENPRFLLAGFYSAPFDKVFKSKSSNLRIFFSKLPFTALYVPTAGTKTSFVVNYESFREAQQHNLFFNQKLAIDKRGDIKNSISSSKSWGNIHSDNLSQVVSTQGFQQLWRANKDQTLICQDCPYRYMCTDERVPQLQDNGIWAHESDCTYDPYSGTWNSEHNTLKHQRSNG
ncbi:MAG TPA: hypothetical protein DCR93_13850 [Cytophagales bacterium]|nr:hypothetical protein [Cytophagales bacterium]HAP60523.1 hypothetical protein [Cytophagales bacterium]